MRIPRCGRGDLGSNPSSHKFLFSITHFLIGSTMTKWLGCKPMSFLYGDPIVGLETHQVESWTASPSLMGQSMMAKNVKCVVHLCDPIVGLGR